MTRRDRSIRHALDKLAISERYAREARKALATTDSYDDRQVAAVLLQCVACLRACYFTAPKARPVCTRCR